jgi:outer membrane protein assembly factor BamB
MLKSYVSAPASRTLRNSRLPRVILTSVSCLLTPLLWASQTRIWTEADYSDFEKGNLKNLSLRSDGLVTLAPQFQEIYDTSSAYLWALARDSKGNLYAGGGPGAKLYRLSASGEKKMLAELDGLQIPAIAIDARDRVYVATAPDGKVYRVAPDGKSEVFYDPKAKYIWALAFDKSGNLLVATGDPGALHRVAPDGRGSVLYQTDETHVRSMAMDATGNVILGTDPGGLVIRVSPAGVGFVLYQLSKSEVTAVAVAKDGSIYAAGVGSKPGPSGAPLAPVPAPSVPAAPGASQQVHVAAPPPSMAPNTSVSVTGSDVYRIDPSGNPEKIWSHAQDIIYAIAFDAPGRVLLGSGNKGYIYRIDSDVLRTTLVTAPSTQITAFQAGPDGALYAATGNVGKIYRLGPGLAQEGSLESEVFDAGFFSQWGRLSYEANLNGGGVSIVARSGNLDRPQKNWSPWSAAITDPKGDRIVAPAARFIQWKATLTARGPQSPELESVDVAYLQRNVPPRIEAIESTPPNYKFPAPVSFPAPSQTLTLPPIGKPPLPSLSLDSSTPSMQYAKGFTGARWAAADDNGDGLVFTVEIRGVHETNWKLLKDKVREKYWCWDSTAFPDGEYRIRVTASDLPGNPPAAALSTSMVSDPFLIDNTPPRIASLSASATSGMLHATWRAADALSDIKKAEYSLDGGDWTLAAPVTALSDSHELAYDLTLDHIAPGEHTLAVRVEDDYDNQSVDKVVTEPRP